MLMENQIDTIKPNIICYAITLMGWVWVYMLLAITE